MNSCDSESRKYSSIHIPISNVFMIFIKEMLGSVYCFLFVTTTLMLIKRRRNISAERILEWNCHFPTLIPLQKWTLQNMRLNKMFKVKKWTSLKIPFYDTGLFENIQD